MWVEIPRFPDAAAVVLSSSSWGCELKYMAYIHQSPKLYRHPLREDVSWNEYVVMKQGDKGVILFVRMWVEIYLAILLSLRSPSHPLREDVSWNMHHTIISSPGSSSSSSWGCELKWLLCLSLPRYRSSSSSWGCELKCMSCHLRKNYLCHPLREDVSWNTFSPQVVIFSTVILFVRMWVEIKMRCGLLRNLPSSSSWGCELKYRTDTQAETAGVVILFVRMWVEITTFQAFTTAVLSSSSWGCELK